ncbi:phospholipase A2 inhibitor and LY6/PLAUR domain containing, partial [Chelydra serpentina]
GSGPPVAVLKALRHPSVRLPGLLPPKRGCLKCERCSSADRACSGEPQDCAPSQTACLILTSETRV